MTDDDGGWPAAFTEQTRIVVGPDGFTVGNVRFFVCKTCGVLVQSPARHDTWHKESALR